jgi:methylated-DNA-protein-cysteine methyltransferase-like protein
MTEFTKLVIEIIQNIPYGKVMTYGQIAAVAGNPRGARQVSRILHSMTEKHQLPWHRVLNSQGSISLTGEFGQTQKQLLMQEGIVFHQKKLDLKTYQFKL